MSAPVELTDPDARHRDQLVHPVGSGGTSTCRSPRTDERGARFCSMVNEIPLQHLVAALKNQADTFRATMLADGSPDRPPGPTAPASPWTPSGPGSHLNSSWDDPLSQHPRQDHARSPHTGRRQCGAHRDGALAAAAQGRPPTPWQLGNSRGGGATALPTRGGPPGTLRPEPPKGDGGRSSRDLPAQPPAGDRGQQHQHRSYAARGQALAP